MRSVADKVLVFKGKLTENSTKVMSYYLLRNYVYHYDDANSEGKEASKFIKSLFLDITGIIQSNVLERNYMIFYCGFYINFCRYL